MVYGYTMKVTKQVRLRARDSLFKAIKNGTVVRPNTCSVCEKRNKYIYGHHEDYFRPLDVLWVCPTCHKTLFHQKRRHCWPEEWYDLDANCLDTQADIDNDRNEAFDRYSHQFELKSPIFGRLHNYA